MMLLIVPTLLNSVISSTVVGPENCSEQSATVSSVANYVLLIDEEARKYVNEGLTLSEAHLCPTRCYTLG